MSHGKQFTLYTHYRGPNGWKVAVVLNELGLTYESVYLDLNKNEQKAPEYTKHNPNGRIPTLIDHQADDFVIWESNAILIYLAEKYDPEHKISAIEPRDKFIQLQWLFFQASGQGPYFGQIPWFKLYHPEKLPGVIERYQKEAVRVLGVLDGVLSKQEWLVGDKLTIADLSFIQWNEGALTWLLDDYSEYKPENFKHLLAWHQKLLQREAVAATFALRQELTNQ